ncbi:MAG: dCMP deaminase family protein [Chloroflexi bacterium]|nr:MAG: dCMP deaminase family protein [Chloroflexota bacterium]
MILAFAAALRSTCLSRKVGCVIVRDGQVIATGYNGTPKGTWHPEEFPRPCPCVGGVSGADLSLKYCAHAEANALAQSAYRGASTSGADIFCTNFPCIECVKLLISAGIHAIYYVHGYPDVSSTRNDTLIAGCGRTGTIAVEGRRTAQTTAATTQRRQEPPMEAQRPPRTAPVGRRRAAPAAPWRCYREAWKWRGAPARRTDWA